MTKFKSGDRVMWLSSASLAGTVLAIDAANGCVQVQWDSGEKSWHGAEVVNPLAEMCPFSTYPEDRVRLLKLAAVVLDACEDRAAVELADLVQAILSDEAVTINSQAA